MIWVERMKTGVRGERMSNVNNSGDSGGICH